MLRDELLRRFPRLKQLPPDCWVVGGAIRDLLLKIEPADVDVACDDPRACADSIGGRVVRLGTQEHLSAWRVVVDGSVIYDFAELLDHDIEADLNRRDFTVNAMGIELGDGKLLDPYDGRRDLDRKLVRMVVPENFDDDPLRCLKGVRMAVKHRFHITEGTVEAMRARAELITRVAAERVTFELSIIFSSSRFRSALEWLHATRLDVPLFGREIDARRFQSDDVSLAGAYALLVENPKQYAKRWRWSADLLREVVALKALLESHSLVDLYDAGESAARQLPALLGAVGRDPNVAMPDFSTRALLNGEEIGLPEGPDLGRVKRALLEAQIRGEVRTRDEAMDFVQRTDA